LASERQALVDVQRLAARIRIFSRRLRSATV